MKAKKIIILLFAVAVILLAILAVLEILVFKIAKEEIASNSLSMSVKYIKTTDKFFNINVEYPQFTQTDESFNKEISDLISQKIASFKKDSTDNWNARIATAPPGQPVPQNPESPFDFIVSWQPTQLNNKYLSFVINMYYFTGGAHGNEELYTFNYDVINKKEITISDFIGSSQDALEKISELSANDITSQLESANVKVDDIIKGMISDGTKATTTNFQFFNFDGNNLIIYFQKYQVAPGYIGSMTVIVPKTTLEQNSINSNYFNQ